MSEMNISVMRLKCNCGHYIVAIQRLAMDAEGRYWFLWYCGRCKEQKQGVFTHEEMVELVASKLNEFNQADRDYLAELKIRLEEADE